MSNADAPWGEQQRGRGPVLRNGPRGGNGQGPRRGRGDTLPQVARGGSWGQGRAAERPRRRGGLPAGDAATPPAGLGRAAPRGEAPSRAPCRAAVIPSKGRTQPPPPFPPSLPALPGARPSPAVRCSPPRLRSAPGRAPAPLARGQRPQPRARSGGGTRRTWSCRAAVTAAASPRCCSWLRASAVRPRRAGTSPAGKVGRAAAADEGCPPRDSLAPAEFPRALGLPRLGTGGPGARVGSAAGRAGQGARPGAPGARRGVRRSSPFAASPCRPRTGKRGCRGNGRDPRSCRIGVWPVGSVCDPFPPTSCTQCRWVRSIYKPGPGCSYCGRNWRKFYPVFPGCRYL